jgi:hypothetical protein
MRTAEGWLHDAETSQTYEMDHILAG